MWVSKARKIQNLFKFVFQTGTSHRMNTTPASPISHVAMTPASLPISGLANLNQLNPTQMQAVQVSHIPTQNQIQPISNTGTLTRIESIKQTTLKKWGTKRNDLIYSKYRGMIDYCVLPR